MIFWQLRETGATGRFFKDFLKRVPPKSEGVIVDEGPSPMRTEKGVQPLTD
jgi:hypothetical protein